MLREVDLVFNDLKTDMNNVGNDQYERTCGGCKKSLEKTDTIATAMGKVRSSSARALALLIESARAEIPCCLFQVPQVQHDFERQNVCAVRQRAVLRALPPNHLQRQVRRLWQEHRGQDSERQGQVVPLRVLCLCRLPQAAGQRVC